MCRMATLIFGIVSWSSISIYSLWSYHKNSAKTLVYHYLRQNYINLVMSPVETLGDVYLLRAQSTISRLLCQRATCWPEHWRHCRFHRFGAKMSLTHERNACKSLGVCVHAHCVHIVVLESEMETKCALSSVSVHVRVCKLVDQRWLNERGNAVALSERRGA